MYFIWRAGCKHLKQQKIAQPRNAWSSLPEDIVNCATVATFKHKLSSTGIDLCGFVIFNFFLFFNRELVIESSETSLLLSILFFITFFALFCTNK